MNTPFDPIEPKRRGVIGSLRASFLTGLVVILHVGLTIWLIWTVVGWIDGVVMPLVPGVPSELRVEVFPFGHVFREGSQVRITVAAPHVHPDLWGFTALPTVAQNTIHTGGLTPSSLVLPLLPAERAQAGYPACGDVHELRNQPCRDAA